MFELEILIDMVLFFVDIVIIVSDFEVKNYVRRLRRRIIGGLEVGEEVEKVKRL